MPLTGGQVRYIIGQHAVEPVARIISRDDKLSHVRNIEHADGVSDGLMFIYDTGILHRHEPPPKWDHSRTEPHVFLVQRRFFLGSAAHGAKLDAGVVHATITPGEPELFEGKRRFR